MSACVLKSGIGKVKRDKAECGDDMGDSGSSLISVDLFLNILARSVELDTACRERLFTLAPQAEIPRQRGCQM